MNECRYVNNLKLLYAQKGTNEPARTRFYDFRTKRLLLGDNPEVMKMFETMYETKVKQLEQAAAN